MIGIGIFSNVCGYVASKAVIKGVIANSKYGIDILDKVLVPIGVEIFSFMAADAATDFVKDKVAEVEDVRNQVKQLAQERAEERATKHNVFDENKEGQENG